VHGDFFAKNVKVSNDHNPIILAFDWEAARWGTPFEDLAALDTTILDMHGVDVRAYWRKVRDRWPDADLDSVEKMVNVGVVFRYLAFIQATSAGRKSDWVEPTVHALCDYEHRLKAGARMAGLI
jgi:aminoglycoside phosphotransferase (APT) family kinase protein